MTEKDLKRYPDIIKKIEYLKKKIEEARFEDITVAGKVKGSSREFPYTERRFSVQMSEPAKARILDARIRKWKKEIEQLEIEAKNIEDFVDNIEEDTTRTIFCLYYLKGMKQADVAKQLNIDQSWVSKKIREYFASHKKS